MVKKFHLFMCMIILSLACNRNNTSSTSSGTVTGQGGSLARFTILGNYLYAVDGTYLNVFDISNPSDPMFRNKVYVGWNIEAIYPHNNKLFIASTNAMFIFNTINPIAPYQESMVQHFNGCDPVVTNDSIAFLTIRGGTRCGSNFNQLNVYDITTIVYPQLIAQIPMTSPYGLGLQDSTLFVCDQGVGLRVLDVSNPAQVKQLYIESGESFLDVIPMDSVMLCMLNDGVAFYDIKNRNAIKKLATIKN